ncbi:hypothetical protein BT69DRAFT_494666 [Atractiella rhizophila]|nr:hypothetical protein BT69DRAFT_494666 [Atractiella rhizophila]
MTPGEKERQEKVLEQARNKFRSAVKALTAIGGMETLKRIVNDDRPIVTENHSIPDGHTPTTDGKAKGKGKESVRTPLSPEERRKMEIEEIQRRWKEVEEQAVKDKERRNQERLKRAQEESERKKGKRKIRKEKRLRGRNGRKRLDLKRALLPPTLPSRLPILPPVMPDRPHLSSTLQLRRLFLLWILILCSKRRRPCSKCHFLLQARKRGVLRTEAMAHRRQSPLTSFYLSHLHLQFHRARRMRNLFVPSQFRSREQRLLKRSPFPLRKL